MRCNMKRVVTQKSKDPNKNYPLMCFRPGRDLHKVMVAVKEKAGVSFGQQINRALARYLPDVTRVHKITVE